MKVFITHYSKYTERKQHVLQQLQKNNITEYEFVELYDKSELTPTNLSMFIPNYSTSIISLVLKHFHIYREIAEKYDSALIFEDDIILSPNFSKILDRYLSDLPSEYDMLFLGDGCRLHIPKSELIPNKYIYLKKYGINDQPTRCTDSYIVSKKCAIALCKYIDSLSYKIDKNIDWFLNRAIKDTKLIIYWAEPTIVTQGSQNGVFKSSF